MKKSITLFLLLSFIFLSQAQISKTIQSDIPGTLNSLLTGSEKKNITNLTINGYIDASDFRIIRDSITNLAVLDISNVLIMSYYGTDGTYPNYSYSYPSYILPLYAFYNYTKQTGKTSLKSVYLPKRISSIGTYAFYGCTGLTSVYANNLVPVDLNNSNSVFYNVNKTTCKLYVPYATGSFYKAAYQWNEFSNIVENAQGFLLTTNSIKLPSNAGSVTVELKANAAWTVSSSQPWLTVDQLSGNTNSTLTLTAEPNTTTKARTGVITVSADGYDSQTIGVIQNIPSKTINNTAGGLLSALTADELNYLSSLTITGTMDARDFKTIRDNMPRIEMLDLSDVTVSAYTGTDGTYSTLLTYISNEIPEYAFYKYDTGKGNVTLKTLKLPSTIYSISTSAVNSCTGLTSIAIPPSINSIGAYSFQNCKGLTSIDIPASIKSIGYYAFNNCTGITSITVNTNIPLDMGDNWSAFSLNNNNCVLHVPYASKALYASAGQWNNFTNIVENAQGFLIGTNKVMLPYNAGSSVSVDLKSNVAWTVTSDQPWLTLNPGSGTGNGTLTFVAENNLNSIYRKAIVTVSAPDCITQTIEVTQSIVPRTINNVAGGLSTLLTADELNSISSITLTGTIDARDFKTMRDNMPLLSDLDLTNVTISAYSGNDGTSYYGTAYPSNTIPQNAFNAYNTVVGKKTLSTLKLPENLTSIGYSAFAYCTQLMTITIPSAVSIIEDYAFRNCSGLTSIYTDSSYPPNFTYYYTVFINVNPAKCTLYVPYKAKTLYANVQGWNLFTTIAESSTGFITATNSLKIDYRAGSTSTTDISANVPWTVTSDQSWLTVSPVSGTGDQKLTFTAERNDTTARRYAKVTISSPGFGVQVVKVTQSGSPKTITIDAGGLSSALTSEELISTTELTIKGTMDARDFKTLRDNLPELAILDLTGATIAAFTGVGGTYDFSAGYPANEIPASAFYIWSSDKAKTSLVSIKIPSSVTFIGSSAFENCTGLTSIYINSVYPVDFTNSGDPFYKTNKAGCTLYVPYATKPVYSTALYWKDFANITEGAQGFYVGQKSVKFNSSVQRRTLSVSIKNNVAWLAQSNQSWLTVSPDVSNNDSTLTLTADPNLSDSIRRAIVTVSSPGYSSQFINVTQAAAPRKVTAGGLSTILTATELSTLTEMALMGTIDARDFKTMRDNMPALVNIDLNGVNVVAYEGTAGTARSTLNTKYPENEIPGDGFSYYIKSVILPETTVSIGSNSFDYASNLTSITWPTKLRTIKDYAFFNCAALSAVNFPDSLISIGYAAFQGCSSFNGQLVLPMKLKTIGGSAFYNCGSLKGTLTIPSSVDSIGGNAFYNCYGLSSLVIKSVDPIIGTNAFSCCYGLKSITLPTTLTTIGEGAFGYCVNLKSIILPPSLKTIGSKAFQVCTGITDIDFPASLTTIGDYAFTNSGLINVIIPSTLTNIGSYAFSFCKSLNSVTFPSTLKKISDGLFTGCTSLYPVVLPSGLEIIGNDAFSSCTALRNIDFPASLTTISDYAFQYCTGLTDITLPNNLISIGSRSFYSCSGLTGIVIPNSVSSAGSSAFNNCTSLKNITFGNSLTGIADYFLYNCTSLNSVTIPSTIISIGADVFNSCTGLTTVTIPNSVTSIGNEAFMNCSYLNNVVIPNSITSIQSSTFNNCTGLKNITIPNSVRIIGYSAFSHCTSLNNLTIPNSVIYITDAAFEYCSSLTSVILPNSITTLNYNTFSHCTNLRSVTIPNSVTTTAASVFEFCTSLTNIILPGSLTNIGYSFFSYCTGLTSIIIPNSVTTINRSAFEYCSSLKNVTIGNSVSTIEDDVFNNCNSLTSISIPASVTSIGSASFSCSGLNSIYAYSINPIAVYSWISVFDNVNKNTCILYVPVGTKSLYKATYVWKDFVNIIEMPTDVPTLNSGEINIYPDPASASFSIHGTDGISTILIYDLNGKVMLCKQVQPDENISIRNFPTGLYIVRIITGEGTIEKKILKN